MNRNYVSPTIIIINVVFEDNVAAQSTVLLPVNQDGVVELEDWAADVELDDSMTW